jgi:hypothetical protein
VVGYPPFSFFLYFFLFYQTLGMKYFLQDELWLVGRGPQTEPHPKMYKKVAAGKETMFIRITEEMLRQKGRPDLTTHINSLGPAEWEKTANKIITKNRMVGMVFQSMADYLTKLEDSPEDWHLAPIRGHTKFSKLFPLYPAEVGTLEVQRITTVSQILDTHLSGRIDKSISPEVMNSLALYPMLQHKLKALIQALLKQPFHNK